MSDQPDLALRVLSGPFSSDETRLGIAEVTIGSGPADSVKVFGQGVRERHLRIFPHIDDTNPDAEPTGWGFAYEAGAAITNSAGDARFGEITPGLTFEIGEVRFEIVTLARGAIPGRKSVDPLSVASWIGCAVLIAVILGTALYRAREEDPTPGLSMAAYAAGLQRGDARLQAEVAACLGAPLTLPRNEREIVPGSPHYAFLTARRDRESPEGRAILTNQLRDNFQRAALFHETGNGKSAVESLKSVVDLVPVSPDNCTIVEAALTDIASISRDLD